MRVNFMGFMIIFMVPDPCLSRSEGPGRAHAVQISPLMEAAAARREQGRLQGRQGPRGGYPPDQGGWRYEDPPGDAVLLTPALEAVQTPVPGVSQMPAEDPPPIFLNCRTYVQDSKDTGHHG